MKAVKILITFVSMLTTMSVEARVQHVECSLPRAGVRLNNGVTVASVDFEWSLGRKDINYVLSNSENEQTAECELSESSDQELVCQLDSVKSLVLSVDFSSKTCRVVSLRTAVEQRY